MTWDVYGKAYENNSDMTNTSIYQPVTFDYAVVLKSAILWLIFYDDPTFDSLTLKIYNNSLNTLLFSSTPRIKADLFTEDYAVKQVYFEFSDVPLGKDTYNFVLNASGYSSASASKHVAWKNTYPEAFAESDVTNSLVTDLARHPLEMQAITSRFSGP